jgi:hypothetical protein
MSDKHQNWGKPCVVEAVKHLNQHLMERSKIYDIITGEISNVRHPTQSPEGWECYHAESPLKAMIVVNKRYVSVRMIGGAVAMSTITEHRYPPSEVDNDTARLIVERYFRYCIVIKHFYDAMQDVEKDLSLDEQRREH